jgi:hypothetical protein
MPAVAAALALSSLLSGGEALVGGLASAGLTAVPAPGLRAFGAALVVAVQVADDCDVFALGAGGEPKVPRPGTYGLIDHLRRVPRATAVHTQL